MTDAYLEHFFRPCSVGWLHNPSETTQMIGSQRQNRGYQWISGFSIGYVQWKLEPNVCPSRPIWLYSLWFKRGIIGHSLDLRTYLVLFCHMKTIHLDPFGCFFVIFRAMSPCHHGGFCSEKNGKKVSPTTGSSSEDDAPPARWAHEFAEPPETPPRPAGATGTTTQCALELMGAGKSTEFKHQNIWYWAIQMDVHPQEMRKL